MESQMMLREELKVVQANELIRSRQESMTLQEAKLVRIAISQVLQNDTDFKTYTVSVCELGEFLGIKKDNLYRDLDDITDKLMRRVICIRGGQKRNGDYHWKKFHWVDTCEYKNGTITVKLSEDLKPYLIDLHTLFTAYEMGPMLRLPSNYAIRLFELLASWQMAAIKGKLQENTVRYSIEYLREYFDTSGKYPNTGDFVKRVITPSINAINAETLMNVKVTQEHSGRTITGLVFEFDRASDEELEEKFGRARALMEQLKAESEVCPAW